MNVYQEFTKLYGDKAQLHKAAEECGEVVQAIMKYLISIDTDLVANDYDPAECRLALIREAIQCEIMINQMRFIFFSPETWKTIKEEEITRLWDRLEKDGITIPQGATRWREYIRSLDEL